MKIQLPKFLGTLLVFFIAVHLSYAQSPNWGWGQPITITGSGNLTCEVYDPIYANTQTYSISASSYDSYIYDEGVLVWTKLNDKVNYMTYDYNAHSFRTGYSYIANSVQVSLSDGIVAFAEETDKVEYAIYDPIAGIWKTGYSYIASPTVLTNNNGVVAWAETNDKVEYATYDASSQIWKTGYSYIANTTLITNNNGVVAWAEATDKVEYAVYDHNLSIWKTGYSYISNNTTLLNEEGVVAWVEENDQVEYAVYDPDDQIWKTGYAYVSSAVTGFSIQDGAVYYTYQGTNYKKGYSFSSGSWQNNANTELHCDLKTYTPSSNPKKLAFFSYMTVGANSHLYNSGDGGTIPDRRLPFKQYVSGGNYNVSLQIFNSTTNTTCNESLTIPLTGMEEETNADEVLAYPNPFTSFIQIKSALDVEVYIYNMHGQELMHIPLVKTGDPIDVSGLMNGMYFMKVVEGEHAAITRIIKN